MAATKHKPSKSDQKRIYLRSPGKKVIKLAAKTVEEAQLSGLAKPIKKVDRGTCWTSDEPIVALSKKQASEAKVAIEIGRKFKSRKLLVTPSKLEGVKSLAGSAKKSTNPSVKPKSKVPPRRLEVQTGNPLAGKGRRILEHDGHPRFQAGIRFLQGGLPELGRRR